MTELEKLINLKMNEAQSEGERMGVVTATLAHVVEKQDKLDTKLFGNGGDGIIARHERKINMLWGTLAFLAVIVTPLAVIFGPTIARIVTG